MDISLQLQPEILWLFSQFKKESSMKRQTIKDIKGQVVVPMIKTTEVSKFNSFVLGQN